AARWIRLASARRRASCRVAGVAAAREGTAGARGTSTWRGAVRRVPLHPACRVAHAVCPAAGHVPRPPTRRLFFTRLDSVMAIRVLKVQGRLRRGTAAVFTMARGRGAAAVRRDGGPGVRDVRLVGLRRGVAGGANGRRAEGDDAEGDD